MKRKNKKKAIIIGIIVSFIIFIVLWHKVHPTYYKYNDSWIIGKTLEQIEERYGPVSEKYGFAANYYLYKEKDLFSGITDSVYYWIYFNDEGIAVRVSEGGPMGG